MIDSRYRASLQNEAQAVIMDVCTLQLGAMMHAPTIETDFVASLIENGVDRIQTAWQRVLAGSGTTVEVGGAICHKSPMVRITDTSPPPFTVPSKGCELADLLVIHEHERDDGRVFWRAVLLQTKAGLAYSGLPRTAQGWLYHNWPEFKIRSSRFRPYARDFNGDTRSGSFSLVAAGGWKVCLPKRLGRPEAIVDLSHFLVDMFYDMDPQDPTRVSHSGRQVYRKSMRHWSDTVWEILDQAAARKISLRGRRFGLYDKLVSRRGGGVVNAADIQGQGDVPHILETDPDDDSGVSVLLIASQSGDRSVRPD